jgi:hypothetical protein
MTRLIHSMRDDYFTYSLYTNRIHIQWHNRHIHVFEMAHLMKVLHLWNQVCKMEYQIDFTETLEFRQSQVVLTKHPTQ